MRTGVAAAIVVVEGRCAALWTETGCGPLMSVRVHLRVIFTEIGYTMGLDFLFVGRIMDVEFYFLQINLVL